MNNLDIPRKCVVLRGGEEFWMEAKKSDVLSLEILNNTAPRFIKLEEDVFNVADITGIFTPVKMAERSKLKRGYWKCEAAGNWHERFEQCDCELSLGNRILRKGSFENWIADMKESLAGQITDADKEIARYTKGLESDHTNKTWKLGHIEYLNQQKTRTSNFFQYLLNRLIAQPEEARADLYPLNEIQIEEFKKILETSII